jgi:hypothetical protein
MYDRPNLSELIDAARQHFETHVIPAIKGDAKLYFQTLVAINVLKVAERQLALGWTHLQAEWSRLDALYGETMPIPIDPTEAEMALASRVTALCGEIRAGMYYGEKKALLFDHLLATAGEALEVANPKFLQIVREEAQNL